MDVERPFATLHNTIDPRWVSLLNTGLKPNGVLEARPESDIHEPRDFEADQKAGVVETDTNLVAAEDARLKDDDVEAEGCEQRCERAIELIAISTSVLVEQFHHQSTVVEVDLTPKVNVQVLKWN